MTEQAVSGQFGKEEKRSASRLALMLRAAKLIADGVEYPCVLRDISPGGVRLRLFQILPEDASVSLELANGDRLTLRPIWREGDHAGFGFSEGRVEIARLLSEPSPFPRRALRWRTHHDMLVFARDGVRPALLEDVSLDGARVDCAWPYPLGISVRLEGAVFAPLHGKVRWRDGTRHGLVFARRLTLAELARLLEALNGGMVAQVTQRKPAPLTGD